MTAALCAAPFSAYATDITPEELLEKSQEASKDNTSMSMTLPMNIDLGVKISTPIDAGDGTSTSADIEMPVKMSGQYEVQMITEPMQMSMTGDFKLASISMMGQEVMPEQSIRMQMYMMQSEDGSKCDTYMLLDDGQSTPAWVHQQEDLSEVLSTFGADDLAELDAKTMEELLPDVELNYELTDGGSLYNLGLKLAMADIMPAVQKALEAQNEAIPEDAEESMNAAMAMLEGLNLNYTMGINKETYLMDTFHMDLNDSDLSPISSFIASLVAGTSGDAAAVPEITLTLNDFSTDGTCTYNDVSEITIPADALATEPVSINAQG